MSAYTDFVKQHIRSAKGAHIKDKMRAVAAMWRARKNKGVGLNPPGMSGRGMRKGKGSMWSDYDMVPRTQGEGVKRSGRVNSLPNCDKMGGALSGMISKKQKAALMHYIQSGGKISAKMRKAMMV